MASDAPNWTSKLGAIAEAATALIALCAFAGAIYQLRRTHKTTLETRAHQYLQRKIVAEWFGEAAVAYWQMAEWLVLHQREQLPEESIYDEWEKMCADIKRTQK